MKVMIIAGPPASGKTAVVKHLIEHFKGLSKPCVCKLDCLESKDLEVYQNMGIPALQGLSQDICPDHYLATNLLDIFHWGLDIKASHLLLETAGLCNRCAPFTQSTMSICVIDAHGSMKAPEKLGPMLTTADVIVMSKTDLVSQAEREVLMRHLSKLNPRAARFEVNGITGYGTQRLFRFLEGQCLPLLTLEGDGLCYPMPCANCAYCVGETRIGRAYQQGMVNRIVIDGGNYAD